MNPLRVLIVEDSITASFMMAEQIHRKEPAFVVFLRKTMKGAIEEAEKSKPDLIIVDLGLPDSTRDETFASGIPALREAAPGCKIMATTADVQMTEFQAIERGADAFMPKLIGENGTALIRRISSIFNT